MFGFFKEVNIRQGGDCYGMWLILRVKRVYHGMICLGYRGFVI